MQYALLIAFGMYTAVYYTVERPKALHSTNERCIRICKLLDIYSGPSRPKKRSRIIENNVNYVTQGFFPYK